MYGGQYYYACMHGATFLINKAMAIIGQNTGVHAYLVNIPATPVTL